MFDAYTVKKVLPRLVIAVILIQLSWFLFTGMISLTNAIAYGVEALIYAPFGSPQQFELQNIMASADGGLGISIVLAAGAGVAMAGVALSLVGTALLAMLIGFALLMFRQVLVVALLVVSPLALVAWILPNTEKFWKLWWESFSKLLIVYPLILATIAIGRVFAYITAEVRPGGGASNPFTAVGFDNIIGVCFIFIGFFGPFFFIPKLFSIAGGAFATVTGMVNDRGRGAFDRLKKGRQAKRAQQWQDTRAGNFFRGGTGSNLRGRLNERLQQASFLNKAGLRPTRWGANIRTAVGAHEKTHMNEMLEKDEDFAVIKGNDDLMMATAGTQDMASLRAALLASGNYVGRERQMEDDLARVERVRRKMGNRSLRQAAWQQAVAGGTAFTDAADMLRMAGEISGGDDSVLADMVVAGRSAAMSAGRVDQGGAGFMTTFDTARRLRDNPAMTNEAANATVYQDVIDSQGAGVLVHSSMKPRAIEQLVPELRRRLKNARDSGNQALYDRELATVANIHEELVRTSPNKARIIADGVMSWDPDTAIDAPYTPAGSPEAATVIPIDGTAPAPTSIGADVRARRDVNSEAWASVKREWGSGTEEDRARRAAEAGGGPPGGGPPGGAPTGLPPGP